MKPESINRLAKKELDKIKIRSRVDILQQEHRQRHNLTVDNIIADLQEYRDICMGRKPLIITTVVKNAQEGTAQSVNTECFVFEPTGANKALELLGKHLGMFKDRVDVTSGGNALPAVINISFSDEPEEP
ncbi:Terminase small subunit [Haemophilus influenzae]|nr:Terminase small subunit [Haemophilus influenzae]